MPRPLLLLLLPWLLQLPSRAEEALSTRLKRSAPYREDRLLLKPKGGINARDLARFHAENHCDVLRVFPGFGGVQVLQVPKGMAVAIDQRRSSRRCEGGKAGSSRRNHGSFPRRPFELAHHSGHALHPDA